MPVNSTRATTLTTPETAAASEPPKISEIIDVTMHPLVLLSAADHYHRVARGTRKRVVGLLLGSVHRGNVDATNSFAVPFEEDSKNPVSDLMNIVINFCVCSMTWCFILS